MSTACSPVGLHRGHFQDRRDGDGACRHTCIVEVCCLPIFDPYPGGWFITGVPGNAPSIRPASRFCRCRRTAAGSNSKVIVASTASGARMTAGRTSAGAASRHTA
jgi:hypothetical protein